MSMRSMISRNMRHGGSFGKTLAKIMASEITKQTQSGKDYNKLKREMLNRDSGKQTK